MRICACKEISGTLIVVCVKDPEGHEHRPTTTCTLCRSHFPMAFMYACACTQYSSIIVDNCKIKYKSYNYICENNETIHSMQTMCKCYLDQVRFLNQVHAIIDNRHYTGLQKRHQHNKQNDHVQTVCVNTK